MHWIISVLLAIIAILAVVTLKFVADVRSLKKKFAHIPQADPERKEHFLLGLANEEVWHFLFVCNGF
jgi:hypothetical protein